MPGNTLMKGISKEANLDDIELIIHKGNFISTSAACHKITWPINPWMSILSVPLNFGVVPGCSLIQFNGDGEIYKCEVWYSGFEFLLEHELRHCRGFKDRLY